MPLPVRPKDFSRYSLFSEPSVSPKGDLVAITIYRPDLKTDDYRGHIWTIPSSGGKPRRITSSGKDGAPKLEGVETDFGVRMISCRNAGEGKTYLRVSNFVMPCHGFVPTGGLKGNPEGYTIHSHVPVDDTHAMRFNVFFRRNRAVRKDEKQLEGGIGSDHIKVRNIRNNYLQDRAEQKEETFTGMGKQFLTHDSCATESMGPLYDRSQEHLGAGDITVIAVRKFLLQAARTLESGSEPPHLIQSPEQNDLRHVACIVTKMDSSIDPKQYIAELLKKDKYWEVSD